MKLENIQNIYFLGIGGIGMSALARYFNARGKNVSGYDKTSTTLTDELIDEGINIHFEDNIKLINKTVINNSATSMIIYTPAIPSSHSELNYFLSNKFIVKKRSEVLGIITQNGFTIAVAGTHGKTTTSSMVAHLLKSAGLNCSAFLGGISKNYNSNLLTGNGKGKHYIVVEADEYDRSFLALHPDISVITSMDADHLDIYGDEKYMIESYRLFASQLKEGGKLIYKKGLPLEDLDVSKSSYAVKSKADYKAENIKISDHKYSFDWKNSVTEINGITSEMPGMHNVENAVAAIAVARQLGIEEESIRTAMSTYTGVKRRFDYQVKNNDIVYIDDYAHHPEELRACILSARELYPGKKILGIFQPHLFSRTRDFAGGFAESLSLLDTLILLDIYPARELPMEGITSQLILEKVTITDKQICDPENVIGEIKKKNAAVILTLGAGDIDQLVRPVKNFLNKRYEKI